jgi:hypothetical protein
MANLVRSKRIILMVVVVALVVLAGLSIYNFSRPMEIGAVTRIEKIGQMPNKDETRLIAEHLVPGREYYFKILPATFRRDYPQSDPVSAQEIEMESEVGIAVVRPNQKYDHDIYYEKTREPFKGIIDPARLGIVVNGDYYFSLNDLGEIEGRITIDQAIRTLAYVKVTSYLQKITLGEVVRRTRENHNAFAYWPTTGYTKEITGFNFEDDKRENFRECYSESDGSHVVCPDVSKLR